MKSGSVFLCLSVFLFLLVHLNYPPRYSCGRWKEEEEEEEEEEQMKNDD